MNKDFNDFNEKEIVFENKLFSNVEFSSKHTVDFTKNPRRTNAPDPALVIKQIEAAKNKQKKEE